MPDRGVLIYTYDGSFDGLLCCLYESYYKKEIPVDIMPFESEVPLLLPVRAVESDAQRSKRVLKSIRGKLGGKALYFVRRSFLTCHPKKELLIFQLLRLGYRYGPSVMNMLTNPVVHELSAAVLHLEREAAHYTGFIRFSESNGVLTAIIEPKNIVFPLIARHFCERYAGERFLIYDSTHEMALIHESGSMVICGAESFEQPEPGEEELKFRRLWRLFYDTIEIKERRNARCRMCHMPKRFWNCMTEFARDFGGTTGEITKNRGR